MAGLLFLRVRRLPPFPGHVRPDLLEKVRARVGELESQMSDPGLSANRKRFQEALTEHRRQRGLMERLDRFLNLQRRHAEAEQMLAVESDPEFRALAQQDATPSPPSSPPPSTRPTLALIPPIPATNAR